MVHSVALSEPTGVAALRRATELARVAGDRSTAATASRELGFVAAGARQGGTGMLREARELATGDDGKLAAVLGIEALALTDSGQFDAAAQRFRRSVELAERADESRKAAWSLTLLARAELIAGEPAAARADIDRARALVTADRWTAFLPLVLAVSAELDLHEDRLDPAGEQLTCAWTLATRLADPCWLAVTGRGLGLLAARRGNTAEAMQWLDGAYHQRPAAAGLPMDRRGDPRRDLRRGDEPPAAPGEGGRRRADRSGRAGPDARVRGPRPHLPGPPRSRRP